MQSALNRALVLCFLGLLLWAGSTHADFCRNNLPASNPDGVYVDNGNGTVTDTRTGLIWKQCAEGLSGGSCGAGSALTFSWFDALSHAESSTFAGHNDWRLPNVKELSSLIEDCAFSPAINTNLFPNTPNAAFWSGSPASDAFGPYYVVFFDGIVETEWFESEFRVRLVREVM